ncbi:MULTISPECIES: capsule assembly Wzi family protein [Gammaproteobacteria]|uniref:capsule assembly Wzi family protein n=1 Tax=Gammaproteobacteria TaxID=1236 RepID=UPI000DD05DD4|nr:MULTISPECIES: capsule assembly Wzi family protein [Gammaproteobacteria]TCZ91407.1 hypothetical protein EYQ95_05645 [Lysobacter sp. N42]
MLADGGYIKGPVNSFPLGWASVARDIRLIKPSELSSAQYEAYLRVVSALEYNKGAGYTAVRIHGETDYAEAVGYSDARYEQGQLSLIREVNRGGIVARVNTNLRFDPESSDDKLTMDGSYLGYVFGNWGVTVDQLPMWWGPGQDQALVFSSNARPIQAIRATRLDNAPIDLPVLRNLGWWHTTAFFGNSQETETLGRYSIAGIRISNSLFDGFEMGLGYTGQWGGRTGRDESSSDAFTDFLTFKSSSAVRNRFASIDFRWSPWGYGGVYGEYVLSQKGRRDTGHLIGFDFKFAGGSLSSGAMSDVFFEISNVDVIYDDPDDPNGHTRFNRNLGGAMGQDAKGFVFGYNRYTSTGNGIEVRVRLFELGKDNEEVRTHYIEPQVGNAANHSELEVERAMIDITYQHPFKASLLRVGVQGWQDTLLNTMPSQRSITDINVDSGISLHASWEWRW